MIPKIDLGPVFNFRNTVIETESSKKNIIKVDLDSSREDTDSNDEKRHQAMRPEVFRDKVKKHHVQEKKRL